MLDPRSFTLARAICAERTHEPAYPVTESWWATAPKPKWQQRLHQLGRQLRNLLPGWGHQERLSVNAAHQLTGGVVNPTALIDWAETPIRHG